MRRVLAALLAGSVGWFALGQGAAPRAVGGLDESLAFEGSHEGGFPALWGGGPKATITLDDTVVHRGRWSARLRRDGSSAGEFSTLTMSLPVDFAGDSISLTGYLRTETVSGWGGLWLRQDGESAGLAFDNMGDRGPRGTVDWASYRIELPLDPEARTIFFGVLLAGKGTLWADDLELLVDGKPLGQAPRIQDAPTVLQTDREFDQGSGIAIDALSETQAESLTLLGKVWGFLKYHHPRVAAGELHWDYELFRVLRSILDAPDVPSRNDALADWFERVGPPRACRACAPAPKDPVISPDLEWIRDDSLGPALTSYLDGVYRRRFAGPSQFYVGREPFVGNPRFTHEPRYEDVELDAGYRILALFRFWNIIEYWSPYKAEIGEEWDSVLREFLPRVVAASDPAAYRLEMLAFAARVNDTHTNLWSSLDVRPPHGECALPVAVRFVEGEAAVAGYTHDAAGPASELRVGDVLRSIDGQPVGALVSQWRPYYAASNDAARFRDMGRALPRGPCEPARLAVEGPNGARELTVDRLSVSDLDQGPLAHDRPGETFQRLSKEVAYLKLSGIKVADVASYLAGAEGARGLVVDIRNYPSEFVVFELGQRLIDEPVRFARFTKGDLSNPGSFSWTEPVALEPKAPRFDGKVAVLVDETSQSQAEYTAMALRAAGGIVVGSTTAGADGNVSPFHLPGGLRTLISGIGVFYPDGTPTQRIGIVPDVRVTPTLAGIREGRDEVLERALREILGDSVDDEKVRRLAGPGGLAE